MSIGRMSSRRLALGAIILILVVAGVSLVLWRNYEKSLPTGPLWIVCSDESCASTTTIAQGTFSEIPVPGGYMGSGYMKGNGTIYYQDDHNALGNDTLINLHADPNSFVTFPVINETYGKDKNSVWFGDVRVQGADAASFTAQDLFGHDAQHAYYEGEVIPGAEPNTFVAVSVNYSKDAEHVYFQTDLIPNADPQTITAIDDYGFAKDKNHVYEEGKIVPGANPATYVLPADSQG